MAMISRMPNTFSARARKLLSTDFEDAIEGDFFRARWVGLGHGSTASGVRKMVEAGLARWVGESGRREKKKKLQGRG